MMPTPFRDAIPSLLTALALAACSSGAAPATTCRTDAQCPAASRCGGGVCVADGRPVAAIRPLATVEAYALVQLDGSESRDPDRGDALAEHLWTVRAVTARCAPPVVAGGTPIALVRFGCPGSYEVSLTVRDALNIESAPAQVAVDVVASRQAPVVTTGPDVSMDHACSGEPLVCRPEEPVVLSASTALPGLALSWSVEPPLDRPLEDGTRRVGFLPGPAVAAPTVSIETDGTAISGDWIFRVEASDAYGVVGAGYTRVSVRNRNPVVVAGAPAPFAHVFDAAAARFTSSGQLAWAAADPDGDPIEVAAIWRHVGDGGASFEGELASSTVTFAVEVPYAAPADALFLRGGAELARTIEIVARDLNRGEGRASVPVEIGNEPPRPAGGVVDLRVPHRFDAARSRYLANVQLGAWVDPDGDPLSAGAGTAPCEAVTVVDGVAQAECSVPFEGVPAVDRIAGVRAVTAPVRDPWSFASGIPVYRIEILNSAPVVAVTASPATFCVLKPVSYLPLQFPVPAARFTVIPVATDPDGDPLLLTPVPAPGGSASPRQAVCTTPECLPFELVQPATILDVSQVFQPRNWLDASDGAAAVEIAIPVTPVAC